MKRFLITSILATIVAAGTALMAQDYPDEYLGLPGDNLNLYAVMKLFQESETLEGFERTLNDENSRINNLDLNKDNYIDYLKVVDYVDGNVHTIVLQAALARNETQDVAVFTVEKFRDGSVQIQLIGDEALYGRNYIIEPIFDETPNPGYLGRSNRQNTTVVRTTTVQIAAWPLVRYIYMPDYVVWRSSWYWGYYPSYWHPWRPYYWHYYYGYHYHWYPHYYSYYRHWHSPRYSRWNDFYYTRNRSYSRNVAQRIEKGDYRTTYSRPESRRDGEALYAKVNPDRPRREAVSTSGTSTGRRTAASQSATSRQSGGTTTTTSRRSSGSGTVSSRSNTSVNRSSNTNRQSSTSVGNSRRSGSSETVTNSSTRSRNTNRETTTTGSERKRTTTPSEVQSTSSVRRSPSTVSGQTANRSSSGQSVSASRQPSVSTAGRSSSVSRTEQSASSARRSSSSGSGQSVSRPASVKRSEPARASRSSATVSGSSSRKSSSGNSRASSTESAKSKESSGNTSSRRK